MASHVYLSPRWAAIQHPDTQLVVYDEGTTLLLVQHGTTISAYETFSDAGSTIEPAAPKWSCSLAEAAPIITLKCSPDGGLLAVQRSKTLIEFVHVHSGNTFIHGSYRGQNVIQGFFFASTPACNLVIVTKQGLELSQYCKYRDGLRSTSKIKVPTTWHQYSPESRILVIGGGRDGSQLHAWQLHPQEGPLKLPSLHLSMLLNPSTGVLDLRDPWQLLAQMTTHCEPRDLRVLLLYGAPYLAHLHRPRCHLHLYRLYRDAVVHHLTYSLFSEHVELSTADSLIIAHHTHTSEAVLFDIRADTDAPIAAPLPLRPPPPNPAPSATSSPATPRLPLSSSLPPAPSADLPLDLQSPRTPTAPPLNLAAITRLDHFPPIAPPPTSLPTPLYDSEGDSASSGHLPSPWLQHSGSWQYICPNVIWDPVSKVLHRLHVDLSAVSRSCADPPLLVGFLSRRHRQPTPLAAPEPKALVLGVLRQALQDELPPSTLRGMFEQLARSYAEVLSAQLSGGAEWSCGLHQVVTPQDVASEVFHWAREEQGLPPLYLQAALSEYELSMDACSAPLPMYLQTLALDIWLQQGLPFQVVQVLMQQPAAVCGLLAKELREGGKAALLPAGEQLCAHLAARGAVGLHRAAGATAALEAQCRHLLQSGRILQAARCAQGRKLEGIRPAAFLEAAARAGDAALFVALYRTWSDALRPVFATFAAAKRHYFPETGDAANTNGGVDL